MAKKTIEATVRLNVDFLGNTKGLLKDLQTDINSIDFGGKLAKPMMTELNKSFDQVYDSIEKAARQLTKSGLTDKQRDTIFSGMLNDIKALEEPVKNLSKAFKTIFDSKENKDNLKTLEKYLGIMTEINNLTTKQRTSQTKRGSAYGRFQERYGVDLENNAYVRDRVFGKGGVYERLQAGSKLTSKQTSMLFGNKIPTAEDLKALDTILTQIVNHTNMIAQYSAQIQKLDPENRQLSAEKTTEAIQAEVEGLRQLVITEEEQARVEAELKGIDTSAIMEAQADATDKMATSITRYNQESAEFIKGQETLNEVLRQFGIVFSAAKVAQGVVDLMKQAFEFYKSLDSALNQIYVVSNLTSKQVDKLQYSFVNMAKETGMALDDVTRAAVLFYQQGLSTDEVLTMTEVTAQFAKVAGIDAADAADKLTAAVNGYRMSAEDAISVADKFNKVAAVSAADINELSTAFSKAAAQANQAGVSMDNYLAYIATMEEATREAPENIGTSLKTIFSRMQQINNGVNEEDETDINKVETALRSVNIALRDTDGQLRDLEEVFAELGPMWNQLDRNTQAYLGTIIAGTRQQSRFITLMQNWDRVLELSAESQNSAGQQALMHAKAMESIESKLEKLNATWQEFVSNLADSSLFKTAISGLTKLVELLNDGRKPLMVIQGIIAAMLPQVIKLFQAAGTKGGGLLRSFLQITGKEKNGQIINAGRTVGFTTEKGRQNYLESERRERAEIQQRINDLDKKSVNYEKQKVKYKKQIEKINKNISKTEKEQLANLKLQKQQLGAIIGVLGQVAGAAISEIDEATGVLVSTLGNVASGYATGGWVGAIVGFVASVPQIVSTIVHWEEHLDEKITEAANTIHESLNKLNITQTKGNTLENQIKEYERLSKKIYRTTAEQEALNKTAQALSDEIDGLVTMSDSYGNLTVNISEARKELNKLTKDELNADGSVKNKSELTKNIEELARAEVKALHSATFGLFNSNTFEEAIDKIFRTNKGEYMNMLTGIADDMDSSTRAIADNVATNLSNNLKANIISVVRENIELYANNISGQMNAMNQRINQLDTGEWNDLYNMIARLQSEVNDMSFAEAQEELDHFYNNWSGKNKLAEEDWEALVRSINGTVFKDTAFINAKQQSDANVKTLQQSAETIAKLQQEVTDAREKMEGTLTYQGTKGAVSGMFATTPIMGLIGIGDEAATLTAQLTEEGQKYTIAKEKLEAYLSKRQDLIDEFKASNPLLEEDDDVVNFIMNRDEMLNKMAEFTEKDRAYLGNLEDLFDFSNLDPKDFDGYKELVTKVMDGLMNPDLDSNTDKYNYLLKYYEEHSAEMTEAYRKKFESMLEDALNTLEVHTPKTFGQISTELQSMTANVRKLNGVIDELNENGSISLETFADLASILDSIDVAALGAFDPGLIAQYNDVLDGLNLRLSTTGENIVAEGDALKDLQDIQVLQMKSKLAAQIADLKGTEAVQKAQKAYIEAQIAGIDATITALQSVGNATVDIDDVMEKANTAYQNSFTKAMNEITIGYENDIYNSAEWGTTVSRNIQKVAQVWSAYYDAIRNGSEGNYEEVKKKAEEILLDKSMNFKTTTLNAAGVDLNQIKNQADLQDAINRLYSYKSKLQNEVKQWETSIKTTHAEIVFLENMIQSDALKNLGSSASKNSKALDQYIGKLEEIYNILRKIEGINFRLKVFETQFDSASGKTAADLLKKRVDLTQTLIDKDKELLSAQKYLENTEQQAIKQTKWGNVFDFDEYGNVQINYDLYDKLSDTPAKEGEKSEKEIVDELYEEYKEIHDTTIQYYEQLLQNQKDWNELLQKQIDTYNDFEQEVSDAVKDVWQKMLDARLEAIDAEIQALDDLRDSYEQSLKAAEDAKALSQLQESLKRSMMDTSGASNSKVLNYRDQIQNKIDEMGKDKYTSRLDDIKSELEDQKEALQKNWDRYFEDETEFHGLINKLLTSGEEGYIMSILKQTDAFLTGNTAEKTSLAQLWDTKYQIIKENLLGAGGTGDIADYISKVSTNLNEGSDRLVKYDDLLKDTSFATEVGTQISRVLRDVLSGSSSSSSSGSGGGGNTGNSGTKTKTPSGGTRIVCTVTITETRYGNTIYTTSVEKGKDFTLPKAADLTLPTSDGYYFSHYIYNGTTFNPGAKIKVSSGIDIQAAMKTNSTATIKTQSSNSNLISTITKNNGISKTLGTAALAASVVAPSAALVLSLGAGVAKLLGYASGGLANFTGPAWLDGTRAKPEAVLNPDQTKAFMNMAEALTSDNMSGIGSTVNIESISFNVDSMSSVADGEKAFDAFMNKFKEIGRERGLNITSAKSYK